MRSSRFGRAGARAALVSLSLVLLCALRPAAATAGAKHALSPWLFVSDVHAGQDRPRHRLSPFGVDTNERLLTSALAAMHRVDPDPPVVVIAGDFVWHRATPGQPLQIVTDLAKRFDATFPRAQFVIALGNNDSDCGDYGSPSRAFLRAVARAWEPLVNRNGASPNFARTFAIDGSYVASLPVRGLRAVAIDDRAMTIRYRSTCGPKDARAALDRFGAYLADDPRGDDTWVVTHVPPGMDAFTTSHLTHRLAVVPFLRSDARNEFLGFVNDPRNRVRLVVAGHTHKFAYRVSEAGRSPDVPILLVPSISPVFDNAPSFLTAEVRADGSVGNVVETSLDGDAWRRIGDLASLGARTFDVPSLLEVQRRLATDPTARARFERLYEGGAPTEIGPNMWLAYWCAATELDGAPYRACLAPGGIGLLTGRAVALVVGALALFALALVATIVLARRRVERRSA